MEVGGEGGLIGVLRVVAAVADNVAAAATF